MRFYCNPNIHRFYQRPCARKSTSHYMNCSDIISDNAQLETVFRKYWFFHDNLYLQSPRISLFNEYHVLTPSQSKLSWPCAVKAAMVVYISGMLAYRACSCSFTHSDALMKHAPWTADTSLLRFPPSQRPHAFHGATRIHAYQLIIGTARTFRGTPAVLENSWLLSSDGHQIGICTPFLKMLDIPFHLG